MGKYYYIFYLLLCFVSFSFAKGIQAGTSIENRALVVYNLGGTEYNLTTNTDRFVVDKVVDIKLTLLNDDVVEVGAGERTHVLSFFLANWGNSEENVTISYEHNASSAFLPENVTIYEDVDRDGLFDSSVDMPIEGDVNLSIDQNMTLLLVADIPDENISIDTSSYEGVWVKAQTQETTTPEESDSVDVVWRSAEVYAQGTFWVRDYWVESKKSVEILNDENLTHTGTKLRYTIDMVIGGDTEGKRVYNVRFKDAIPEGTAYIAKSLRLNQKVLSDAKDTDKGDVNATHIVVDVGTLEDDVHKAVRFDVVVK